MNSLQNSKIEGIKNSLAKVSLMEYYFKQCIKWDFEDYKDVTCSPDLDYGL